MITEKSLKALSYSEAPKILTSSVPGPKGRELYDQLEKYTSPTRVPIRTPGALPVIVCDEGRGATVKDVDGNVYIDLSAGVAVNSVGRNHPLVVEAARRQAQEIMHAGTIVSPKAIEFSKKMSDIMPQGLRGNCFTAFTQSGSGAIETAIKYVHALTGKSQIVAFEGAYHGAFMGSLALTTRAGFRQGYYPMMPGVVHLPYAYCYRCFANLKYPSCEIACAKYFVQKLNSPYSGIDDLGAIFIEPVQGEGGYINPPVEFIKIIKTACEKNGILFVADEVQCGAGRTGKMWGIEYYDVIPDMLVFGKGIGGDQPIAGVSVRNEYKNKLRLASHGNTFSENALGCAVAFANIEILTNPEWDLMGRAAKLGEEIKKAFHSFAEESPVIGDVRGKGLMIGIELVKDKNTREPISNIVDIINKACEKGLLMLATGRHRNVLRLAPSLIISQELLDKATHILVEVIKENESVLRT